MRAFDQPGRSPVYAGNALAATSHPLATSTALSILRDGGNAVDAAIAASATLCVVEPHMTGIGGDCFAILCEPDGSIHGLNGSGRAPGEARLDWYRERNITGLADSSPHAVTVPGAVRAWEVLHQRFGAMDWTRLFADAVHYANEGFAVAPRVARDWAMLADKLATDAGAKRHLLFDGEPPASGQRVTLPALGAAIEAIARGGSVALYEGVMAQEIAETVQALGGFLTEADLAACEAEWVTPISSEYRGLDILEIPPNGQGLTALILLNLLKATDAADQAFSAARYHREIELSRIAYAVRDAHIGDPTSMVATVERLLSAETADRLSRQFDPRQRNPAVTLPDIASSDTIYLSIVDREQRAISFINSVYGGFGTGIVTAKSGIALQNRGACFSLTPGHPNALGPGKRPLHTIIPAMALAKGKPVYSFGVMGGAYQPVGHAHVLANMLDYGMDPQQALDFPRLFWDDAGRLAAESGIGGDLRDQLSALGHSVVSGGPHGGGQIIHIDHETGMLTGGSDPRKDGQAAGF